MTRWSLLLVFALTACSGGNNDPMDDPDSGATQTDTGDSTDTGSETADTGETTTDMGSQADMAGNDDTGTAVDMGPPENVCETAEVTEDLECDVVDNTGCPEGAVCQVLFVPSEMQVRPACTNPDPDATLSNGDACGGMVAEKCPQSSNCYLQECHAWCRVTDGAGCADGEFCKIVDPNTGPFGIGLCVDSCD
jgi:hypothetical protein